MEKEQKTTKSKVLSGVVVSDKMKDTAVVKVDQYLKHPRYGKYVRKSKKYKAHDVGNTVHVGDKVQIIECKPVSKDKHFRVINK